VLEPQETRCSSCTGAAPATATVPEAEPNTRCPVCKNPIPAKESPQFVCPLCQSKLECLFAVPIKVVQRPVVSEICTFHPGVPAASRCRSCRKAICETCAFRARGGVYCPDCAAAPDESRRRGSPVKGVISLVCGIVGLLAYGVGFVATPLCENQKAAEGLWTGVSIVSLVVGLVAVAMGFISRDPARARSLPGLIGIIVGFLDLAIYALLAIAGAMMGGK
jgi:hypothetical protein